MYKAIIRLFFLECLDMSYSFDMNPYTLCSSMLLLKLADVLKLMKTRTPFLQVHVTLHIIQLFSTNCACKQSHICFNYPKWRPATD